MVAQKPTRGAKVEVKCKTCRNPFMARKADRDRGWARFCSKSCKAIKQTQRTGRGAPRPRPDYFVEARDIWADDDTHPLSGDAVQGGEWC